MIVVDCVQGTEEWANARRGVITASRMGDILTPKTLEIGAAAKSYAYQLIAESIVPPHYWIDEDTRTPAMQHGSLTEREARDYFAFDTGCEVEQVGFCLSDDRRFGCSPDALVNDGGGLELKCPLHKTQVEYLLKGTLPDKYKAQVHGSMLVTRKTHWWFMSYAAGLPPLVVRVELDEYTQKLAEALEKFWAMLAEMKAKIQPGDPVATNQIPQESYW